MKERLHMVVRGAVQGVGFRPFIHRLASEMHLNGYVLNAPEGVFIEAESEKNTLDEFVTRIEKEKPAMAVIQSMEFSFLNPVPYTGFDIRPSRADGKTVALILPDIAVCPDCLRELFDPSNRRYEYPFINCTHCGPRFSIIESLPYDRPNTSMKDFTMCPDCLKEYSDPKDRRFHAQPTACPVCGPSLTFIDQKNRPVAFKSDALAKTVNALLAGKIVAMKGLGGFQLLCDASKTEAIEALRRRKHRDAKPFALMFPDLESVRKVCHVESLEERLLTSPESPIVLLRRKEYGSPSSPFEGTAPGSPYLGVLLPYTPLHALLMKKFDGPVICTSGNLSEEPMCFENDEARTRLGTIADVFLLHDRPIERHVDDSIVRISMGRELVLRRARGYAPLPLAMRGVTKPFLALGAHLKNAVAVAHHEMAFMSQHMGDLSTEEAYRAFTHAAKDLPRLYAVKSPTFVCDAHPDYLSTKYARSKSKRPVLIQHHEAHVAACYAENQLQGEVLGVAWDGTGFGGDGTIWGGEFFLFDGRTCKRVAHLRTFPLPGGDAAVKESKRAALGLLYELFGDTLKQHDLPHFTASEFRLLTSMLRKNLNCTDTSSMGRLFDAVTSVVGLNQVNTFEGQSAMMLEYVADRSASDAYSFSLEGQDPIVVDWEPVIRGILNDSYEKHPVASIAGKFHNALADVVVSIANKLHQSQVVLSGGCFQNVVLLEKTVDLLTHAGVKPYWHQRIPPNDGGIAIGQIALASAQQS